MRAALPLFLVLLLAGPAVGRQEPDARDLPRLQAEQRDAQARAQRLRADAAEARSELRRLEARLEALRREASVEDARVVAQRARLRELNAREAELGAELGRARGAQGRVLSALQRLGRDPPPALLIPADQAIDATRAAILMKAVAPELEARARRVTARQAELARVRRLAALSSTELFALESDRIDRRAEIDAMTARRLQLVAVLDAEAAEAERAAQALERRIRALGGQTLPVAARTATARLPAGRSSLTPPVDGASEKAGAGRRWIAPGASARAPADARVAHAGPLEGWGEVVILDLGPGWRAVLAGLEDTAVAEGQVVEDGQALGRAGDTLYFELRRDDDPVDPGPWLD